MNKMTMRARFMGVFAAATIILATNAMADEEELTIDQIKEKMVQTCTNRSDAVCASGFVLQAIKHLAKGGAGNACRGYEVENTCMYESPGKNCREFCREIGALHFVVSRQQCEAFRNLQGINYFGNTGSWSGEPPGCFTRNGEFYYNSMHSSTFEPQDRIPICNCR